MTIPTLVTFIAYFVVLLAIGLYFCRPDDSIEGYLLGKRGMGAWVTALSTQASDMSGWLLMGLPGVIYAGGIANAWIAIGLFIGTILNWKQAGLSEHMYEIVPGFVANSMAILLVNRVAHQKNAFVLHQFDEVVAELQSARANAGLGHGRHIV